MGTLTNFVPILGILAGYIIAKLTPYELKSGGRYFRFLMYTLLATVIGIAAWQYANGIQINVVVPFFLFFIPFGTVYNKKYAVLIGGAVIYATGVLIAANA